MTGTDGRQSVVSKIIKTVFKKYKNAYYEIQHK
jgi:hypothetical protein